MRHHSGHMPQLATSAACLQDSQPPSSWLGATVCELHGKTRKGKRFWPSAGRGTIVDMPSADTAIVRDRISGANTTHLGFENLVILSPGGPSARTSCWPVPVIPGAEKRPLLSSLQRRMSQLVYEGEWVGTRWHQPSVGMNSTTSARVFNGSAVVVIGASPMRQLSEHFAPQMAGMFDQASPNGASYGYVSCERPFGKGNPYADRWWNQSRSASIGATEGWMCENHPCNATQGFGCADCRCCVCRECFTHDFTVSAALNGGGSAVLHFSEKPELIHTSADHAAMAARFCRDPPDMLVVQNRCRRACTTRTLMCTRFLLGSSRLS